MMQCTSSDLDNDESAANNNDKWTTEDDATVFARFRASGLPASLKAISCATTSSAGATLQRTSIRMASSFGCLMLSSLAVQATASTPFASSSPAAPTGRAAFALSFLAGTAISPRDHLRTWLAQVQEPTH
eukprot:6202884-Pleurochrysis_carterae.AAC.1